MRIAVTGASGFLGRVLIESLISEGHTVVALSRSTINVDKKINASIQWKQVNFENIESISNAIVQCEAVVHLAGIAHAQSKEFDKKSYFNAICKNTDLLIQAAIRQRVGRFLYASSIKVYGEKSYGIRYSESSVAKPESVYGLCKLQAEEIVNSRNSEIDVNIFRFPPMYGEGMKGSIKYLFAAANLHLPLPLHGIKAVRYFLYVGNACSLIAAGLRGDLSDGTFNVYEPVPWKIGHFYDKIFRSINGKYLSKIQKLKLPLFLERLLGRLEGFNALINSFELGSEREPEWTPYLKYTTEEGIDETVDKSLKINLRKSSLANSKRVSLP